jgi:hypothetical protein
MEEESSLTFTSAYPPVFLADPQNSVGNVVSLSTAEVLQKLSTSWGRTGKNWMPAHDQFLGKDYVFQTWYGMGQHTVDIRPNGLSFFKLMIIAQMVHDCTPEYLKFEKNCYWYCSTVYKACKLLYGKCLEDGSNHHWDHAKILGWWNGLKASQMMKEELSAVVQRHTLHI